MAIPFIYVKVNIVALVVATLILLKTAQYLKHLHSNYIVSIAKDLIASLMAVVQSKYYMQKLDTLLILIFHIKMQPKIFGENWYAEAVKLQSKNSDISETNTPFSNNINKTTTLKTHLDHLDSEVVKKVYLPHTYFT